MNLNIVKINVLVLVLVIECNGGLVSGVFERIQNTTHGLRQDVKNVWSYSKGVVGLGEEPGEGQKEEERGLIGGMIHSAHEKAHAIHEFWVVDDIPNDSGLLWGMYCRFKQRLAKAKNYILGNGDKPVEKAPLPTEEAQLIKDTMEKIFFADGTRKINGDEFNKAVENLRKQLNEMRKKSGSTTATPVDDGEGLIDIRMGDVDDRNKDIDAAAVDKNVNSKDGNINAVSENILQTMI